MELDLLRGFGKRPYDWEVMAGVQHELLSGVSVDVGYFRHWFRKVYVGNNLALAPSDFDSYCVTSPSDSRLPGGGGNQICGFYDVKPTKFGQVDNLVTFAENFGDHKEVYNGVDFNLNARFRNGAFLQGGVTVGRTTTDTCYANALPQLDLSPSNLPGSVAGTALPRTPGFCDVKPPLAAGTQVKLAGSYRLPWRLRTSATFQNTTGPAIGASIALPNAQVATTLGRSLNSTVTVELIPPQTLFEKRISQLDWRLSRDFRIDRYAVQAQFDLYNAFNSGAITALNTRYGPQWLRPTSILAGRVLKFGTQIEF